MEINNEDKEIVKELQNINKDKKDINKTRKIVKFAMWAILVCNFIAGCFMGSIYFFIDDIIYLIIGIVVILLDIPAYILLKGIVKKIEGYNKNNI